MMKRTSTLLLAVAISVAFMAPPVAEWGPERLPAPAWESIVDNGDSLTFDWSDVYTDAPDNTMLAPKYSLDIDAVVTYTPTGGVETQVTIELSFGTSDRNDGGVMADSDLTISDADLRAAVLEALGLTEADVDGEITVEGSAKVKALDPGKGKGPQNNPFSDSEDPDAAFSADL
jgi:hypothetical protein